MRRLDHQGLSGSSVYLVSKSEKPIAILKTYADQDFGPAKELAANQVLHDAKLTRASAPAPLVAWAKMREQSRNLNLVVSEIARCKSITDLIESASKNGAEVTDLSKGVHESGAYLGELQAHFSWRPASINTILEDGTNYETGVIHNQVERVS